MDTPQRSIPDNYLYRGMNFQPETLKFFIDALDFYLKLLETDLQAIKADTDLSKLLGEDQLASFGLSKEQAFVRYIQRALKEALAKNEKNSIFCELEFYHAWVRVIKSVGTLYLKHLEGRRNNFARKESKTSQLVLRALDTQLAALSEKIQMGFFRNAEQWPLLIEDIPEANAPVKPEEHKEVPPPPKIASTIEILDPQLRERCLDIFNQFTQDDQSHRFDTVISEATRILEDRIRLLSQGEKSLFGVDLATFAFKPPQGKLLLGETTSEQEAAHLLFRGVTGFIRNPFHHRLEKVEKERVVQILGLIDYLLYLTEAAAAEMAQNIPKSTFPTAQKPQ